jgi:hypothetical protein
MLVAACEVTKLDCYYILQNRDGNTKNQHHLIPNFETYLSRYCLNDMRCKSLALSHLLVELFALALQSCIHIIGFGNSCEYLTLR